MVDLRPSPIAGTWYPGDPEVLARSVDAQLQSAQATAPQGEIVALVVPHAGHRYSGKVAALGFGCLRGLRPEIVAVVSPMHHPYSGRVLTSGHEAYETPLGEVPIDRPSLERFEAALGRSNGLRVDRVSNDQEHSLEIELPFLQRVLEAPFRLLPLMLRDQSQPAVEAVGHALATALQGAPALLVASSDLSHFYPDPLARRLDAEMLARIGAFDPAAVLAAEDEGVGFACGRGAVAAVLWAARDLGADRAQVLGYANSGDATGDYDSVVGYGAAVLYRAASS